MEAQFNTGSSEIQMPFISPELDQVVDKELAGLGKAISHPIRVKILRILAMGHSTCGGLVEQLPLAQSTVSQHLKVLRQAGLITGQEVGSSVFYSIDHDALRRLRTLVVML